MFNTKWCFKILLYDWLETWLLWSTKEIIGAMNKIQSQSTTSTSSITMAASVEAISGPQDFILDHNKKFIKEGI